MRRSREKLATIKKMKGRKIWRVIVRDKWGGTQYECGSLKEARRLAERQEANFNEKAFESWVNLDTGERFWTVIDDE